MTIPVPSSSPSPIGVGGVIQQDPTGAYAAIVTAADAATKAALAGYTTQQIPLAFNGTTFDIAREPKVQTAVAKTAATAEATIWTPASGKKFRLLRMLITVSVQSILTFKDNTAGTTILVIEPAANTPLLVDLGRLGILSAAADNVLTVTRATSCTLNGVLMGTEE